MNAAESAPVSGASLTASGDRRLRILTEVLERAVAGDLEARLDVADDDQSPTADLALAINAFIDMVDAFVRESAASLEPVSRDEFHRRVLERGLAGSFRRGAAMINAATRRMGERADAEARQLALAVELEKTVSHAAAEVAAAAEALAASATALHATAERATQGAVDSAAAATATTEDVSNAARCAEQLRTEISNIARRAGHGAAIADRAVEGARGTEATVEEVVGASRRIDHVVRLISTIAAQTKLLALNAAIEAARAGEAGKGFGVVSSEVKALAGEASKATGDIAEHIRAIQAATRSAAEATRGVTGTIHELHEMARTISGAVEAQAATTAEFLRSVEQASHGTETVSASVSVIVEAAGATRGAAMDLKSAAADLSRLASHLTSGVSSMLSVSRAARGGGDSAAH
jgi:methyl-accepting chemotaxis protein